MKIIIKLPNIRKTASFQIYIFLSTQGFGREKDGNHGKFIGSNVVIFCYKEFEKFALCTSISN